MSEVKIIPISESEYETWSKASRDNYRDEHFKNGMTFEEAQKRSDEDFEKLLPQGRSTPEQYLFSIKVEGELMGTIWFGVRGPADNRKAYIYDIVLNENSRGKGYGKKAMILIEDEVKKIGLKHIGLHVFGHNKVARNLYESLNYQATNIVMEKVL